MIFVARPIFTAFRRLVIRLSQHCEKGTSLLELWGCGIFLQISMESETPNTTKERNNFFLTK